MEFRILGAIGLWRNDGLDRPKTIKARVLLGALLWHPGEHVSVETLVSRLWEQSPRDAREALAPPLSRLRGFLRKISPTLDIKRESGSYWLPIDPNEVDYHRFQDLVTRGRRAAKRGDPHEAVALFHDALSLWRGELLAELTTSWAVRNREMAASHDLLPAYQGLYQAELALGNHHRVEPELGRLIREHDTNETLAALWMRTIAETRGPGSARTYYRGFRKKFLADTGSEPNQELVALYAELSRHTPPAPAQTDAQNKRRPQQQLPRSTTLFTGRSEQLGELDKLLIGTMATPLIAISGPPGVGKTALVVHWATERAAHFPDGNLFADLGGHSPAERKTSAALLSEFLTGMDLAAEHLPAAERERVELLRRSLAGRRILVILDNVRDAAHIRPILPALASSAVLITGRNQLTTQSLGAETYPIKLSEFTRTESIQLLVRRINSARGQPDTIADLADVCGDLPLALRIAADYAATNPQMPMNTVVAGLRERRQLLLDEGVQHDDATLRTVFQSSIDSLAPAVSRFFALLGLFPGTCFSVAAVAALTGLPEPDADRILRVLTSASLIDRLSSTGYRLHDLLHVHATELAQAERPAVRAAAVRRLLDYYLATLLDALRVIDPPGPQQPELLTAVPRPTTFDDHDAAWAWCESEQDNLLSVSRLAGKEQFHEHCWRLVSEVIEICNRNADPNSLIDIQGTALRSAEADGNQRGTADLLNNLGTTYLQLGRYAEAAAYFESARDIDHAIEDREGEAIAIMNSGTMRLRLGRYAEALRLFRTALKHFNQLRHELGRAHVNQRMGDAYYGMERFDLAGNYYKIALKLREAGKHERSQGESWTGLGLLSLARKDYPTAIRQLTNGLALHERTHDEIGIARARENLGAAYQEIQQYDEAAEHSAEAISHYSRMADLRGESRARDILASASYQLGNRDFALANWQQALDTLRRLGDDDAGRVAENLAAMRLAEKTMPGQRAAGSSNVEQSNFPTDS